MPKSAMSGQRPASRSRDSGHSGASVFPGYVEFPGLSRSVASEDRRYLIATNRGDEYLERVETGQWEAVKLHFHWTKDADKAQVFNPADLSTIFQKVVHGFSGPKIVRVS
jgi:hypothetical protein